MVNPISARLDYGVQMVDGQLIDEIIQTVNQLVVSPGGSVSVTDAGTGYIVVTPSPGTGVFTLDVNVGTGPSQVVALDGTSKLPAVDGSQLTNLPGGGGSWVAAQVAYTLDNTTPTDVVLDLTVMAMRVGITTDGSGLVQTINVPTFTLDANGEASKFVGYRVSITTDVLADNGDMPLATIAGGNIRAHNAAGFPVATLTNGTGRGTANAIPLDYLGATTSFVWDGSGWNYFDIDFNNDATATVYSPTKVGAFTEQPTLTVDHLNYDQDGVRAFVSDALDPVVGQPVVGGGSVFVPVFWNGSNWICDAGETINSILGAGTTILNFTATFGAITALTGTAVTQAVTGLLTTDQCHVECVSAPPSGYIPPNARCSTNDTLELYFNTAVAIGITLGSLDFRLTVIR